MNKLIFLIVLFLNFLLTSLSTFAESKIDDVRLHLEYINISALKLYPGNGVNEINLSNLVQLERSRYPEEISLNELKLIADSLTRFYRSKGFKFHSVYLPPQKLGEDHSVYFEMLEAKLGDVQVRGGDNAIAASIDALFKQQLGKTLYQPNIDNIVLGMKEQYGLDAFTYYSRGATEGTVRLNIKVNTLKNWQFSLSADNFGSESTGKERLLTNLNRQNLLQSFDQLSLGIQSAVDGESNLYGFLDYSVPVYSLDHRLGFRVSNNVFEVGQEFARLEIEGDVRIIGVDYTYTPLRTFEHTHKLTLGANYKTNDYENVFNDASLTEDETSKSADLGWHYSYRPKAGSWLYRSNWTVSLGSFETGQAITKEHFAKIRTSHHLEWTLGEADSTFFSSFRNTFRAQGSTEPLPSFEKFAMTGAYAIRDYAPGYFSADNALMNSLEWWFPRMLSFMGDFVNCVPFIYADAAYGETLDDLGDYKTGVKLAGAGIGLQIMLGRVATLSFSSGKDLQKDVRENLEPEDQSFLARIDITLP